MSVIRILKRTLIAAVIIILAAAGLLAWTFSAKPIAVGAYDDSSQSFSGNSAPDPSSLPDVSLSLIKCGLMTSKQSFIFRGGSWSEEYRSGMTAALVRHPRGSFLFDAGFGSNVDQHVASMPWLMQKLANYQKETPASVQLDEHGFPPDQLKTIFISHSHWDHVSGAEDFPNAEVWLSKEEAAYVAGLNQTELIKKLQGKLKLRTIELSGPPYENFERSLDLYGDGTVVFVPLEGHTPGSIGMFVNLRSGKRFFFIGDLTWAIEGIQIPTERPWLSRRLVDFDEEGVRRSIVKVHNLASRYPGLVIVPAHDRRIHEQIAAFPDAEH
jgi:glyoxylase-like metal-dependent hydrolase (beta-lactamase superfamily II)